MTEQTILAPIELTDDELLAVSGGQNIAVNVVHSGGNEANTIGTATGGNSGGTNNENGGNATGTLVGTVGNGSSFSGSLSVGAGSSTSITFVNNS